MGLHAIKKPRFAGEYELMDLAASLRDSVHKPSASDATAAERGLFDHLLWSVAEASKADRAHALGKLRMHCKVSPLAAGRGALSDAWRARWLAEGEGYVMMLLLNAAEANVSAGSVCTDTDTPQAHSHARALHADHRCCYCCSCASCFSLSCSVLFTLPCRSAAPRFALVEWLGSACSPAHAALVAELTPQLAKALGKVLAPAGLRLAAVVHATQPDQVTRLALDEAAAAAPAAAAPAEEDN